MRNTGRDRGKRWLPALMVLVLIAGYSAWAIKRPLPLIAPAQAAGEIKSAAVAGKPLAWPVVGQAAVGIVGTDITELHGKQVAAPIASVAKIITALTVLNVKPINPGQPGPTITLTDKDVASYNSYAAEDGSVVRVQAGEQISEYQMLQTIMLPSANNMADSLAIWAFGSLKAYGDAANSYISSLGLKSTRVGSDASGLSPTTSSTAADLLVLGEAAMKNPVLADVAGQATATGIPVVNDIKNVNYLLGGNNIVGIKTGNTDQAGGVFLGAAKINLNDKPVVIVTAVVGSPSLFEAMKDSQALIKSAQTNFGKVRVAQTGSEVGSYKVPWGGTIPAAASDDLELSAWGGSKITATTYLQSIKASTKAGQAVGSILVTKAGTNPHKSIDVKLNSSPGEPTVWWRLLHPLQ